MLQPARPQRTPPSSPVEDIVDDGQFQFSPPTSRRQLFAGSSGEPRASLRPGADVRATPPLSCQHECWESMQRRDMLFVSSDLMHGHSFGQQQAFCGPGLMCAALAYCHASTAMS